MPTVVRLTGPLAGKEHPFDAKVDRITFGRDESQCDVVFPVELNIVGRTHFALRRVAANKWAYEELGKYYVKVDGRFAKNGAIVEDGSVIELGAPGGPSLEVKLDTDTSRHFDTVPFEPPWEWGQKLAVLGAVAASLMVVAFVAHAVYVAGWQAELAGRSIGPEVSDRLERAAYVVVVQSVNGAYSAEGTASPIRSDLLVTNAHVAEIRENLKPGEKLLVRAPGKGGKLYEVIDHTLHPGYRAFKQYLKENPIYVPTPGSDCSPSCLFSVITSYDVALLKLAPASNAGPLLELASPKELHDMRPGMSIALAGYPLENIRGSEIQGLSATPNYRAGVVSSMTDMFNLTGEVPQRRLIHHNIPVTGGNSGSPMVNAGGKLVGLLNAGNVLRYGKDGRMPNAAVVNYGQRADLVRELVDGTAEANLAAERAYWARQAEIFYRGRDLIVKDILAKARPANLPIQNGNEAPAYEKSATMSPADAGKVQTLRGERVTRQQVHKFQLKAKVPGVFVAYADDRRPIQLYLIVNGNPVRQDVSGTWYPSIRYTMQQDTDAEVYVVSDDLDVRYTLLQYVWPNSST
jgi:hypothetical protein